MNDLPRIFSLDPELWIVPGLFGKKYYQMQNFQGSPAPAVFRAWHIAVPCCRHPNGTRSLPSGRRQRGPHPISFRRCVINLGRMMAVLALPGPPGVDSRSRGPSLVVARARFCLSFVVSVTSGYFSWKSCDRPPPCLHLVPIPRPLSENA